MRRAGLRAKVARLERQSLVRRFPRVCAAIYDIEDENLIGVEGWLDGVPMQVARLPGETLQALATRAFATGAVLNLAAQYRQDAISRPAEADLKNLPMQILKPASAPIQDFY